MPGFFVRAQMSKAKPKSAGGGGASFQGVQSQLEQLLPVWTKWVVATLAAPPAQPAAPTPPPPQPACTAGPTASAAAAPVPLDKLTACVRAIKPLIAALNSQLSHSLAPTGFSSKKLAGVGDKKKGAAVDAKSGELQAATALSLDFRVFDLCVDSLRCAVNAGSVDLILVCRQLSPFSQRFPRAHRVFVRLQDTIAMCSLLCELDVYRDAMLATDLTALLAPLLSVAEDKEDSAAPASVAAASNAVILAASRCLEQCRKCAPFSTRYIGFGRAMRPLPASAAAPAPKPVASSSSKPQPPPPFVDRLQPAVLLTVRFVFASAL
jgi:hypothetical protein